jgi:HK97 family phage prohead protease
MRKFITPEKFKEAVKGGEAPPETGLRKEFIAEVKAEADDSRVLTFTISTASVDRQGDSVAIDGWELGAYRKNPVVLWAHDYTSLPLARSLTEWKEGGALKSRVEFTPAGMARFNDTVFDMYKGGFLSAVSVGFLPTKWAWAEDEGRKYGIDFLAQELLEFSCVPVPANAEALIEARSAGLDMEPLKDWAASILKEWDRAEVTRLGAELQREREHSARKSVIAQLRKVQG